MKKKSDGLDEMDIRLEIGDRYDRNKQTGATIMQLAS
jgi:hypothetical protein